MCIRDNMGRVISALEAQLAVEVAPMIRNFASDELAALRGGSQ
eukprot:NODE_13859_length_238_cov_79.010929.p4 GENE.NODE_13859_length_238_cov_79.010929~~NODE_13859_length_238_cov_79.010929.p4  ORF type:complete len:51 (+),score=5.37 NODE_13859_length_238_cov_79.010929:27-155(+)